MTSKREKEALAVKCAEEVFTRYGYARTTMGDIAAASGMSRPALYLLFSDKDAVFSKVIEEMDRRTLDKIRSALRDIEPLREKLLHACTTWGLHGVELAAAHPDAADLFDLRFVAVRQVYGRFQELLVAILGDAVTKSDLGVTTEEFATTLTYGMRGLRYASSSVDDMKRMIEVHVEAYARALGSGGTL
ncbi:TetR/AcrR family transcriptional regulator [Neorhizobium galegae]|uniref:TetR/AcrR family transcriptional regulator n=1 Tax=Neorhizobium galegae TaxID=399 RepID=UPI0006277EBE|nr:TetR/AcrR family transcriptional regulator [Neorhizobium galegae]